MYERIVVQDYLRLNPSLSSRFVDKGIVDQLKLLDRLKDVGINAMTDQIESDAFERNAKQAKQRPRSQGNGANALPPLDQMASKVGWHLDKLYGPCFLQPTYHHHANTFGIALQSTQDIATGQILHGARASEASLTSTLSLTHTLLAAVWGIHNDHFQLNFDSELSEMYGKIQEIFRKDEK